VLGESIRPPCLIARFARTDRAWRPAARRRSERRCSSSASDDDGGGFRARCASSSETGGARSRLWMGPFEVWGLDFEIGEAGGAERVGQPLGIPDYYEGQLIGMDD
jgi:hypothetical protein